MQDINDSGEIVGAGGPGGFLIGKRGRITKIQCPGGSGTPKKINNSGEISGFCSDSDSPKIHGFFRNKRGSYTILDFPGALLTEAIGVNNRRDVVGDYQDSDGNFHGFIWDDGAFVTFDVSFTDAVLTGPHGINKSGEIVGFYDKSNGERHGFIYRRGEFISVEIPGAQMTALQDINERGEIVGLYADDSGVLHSFLLHDETFIEIVVPFEDVVFTEASGLNNHGDIVGHTSTRISRATVS